MHGDARYDGLPYVPLSLSFSESYDEYNQRARYEMETAGLPKAYRFAARLTKTTIRSADRSLFADTKVGRQILERWDESLETYFRRHPNERTAEEPPEINACDSLFPSSVLGYKQPDRVRVCYLPDSSDIPLPDDLTGYALPLTIGSTGTVVGIHHMIGMPGIYIAAVKLDGARYLWDVWNEYLERLPD